MSRSGQSWASNWSQPVAVAMARYALSVHRFQSRGERTRAGNGAGQWWHWGSFPSLTMGRLVFSPHEKDGTISTDETESVKWEERDGAEVVADPARHCNLARGGSLVCLACLSLSRTPGRNGGGLNGAEREGRAHPFPSRSSLKTCLQRKPTLLQCGCRSRSFLRAHAIPTFPSPPQPRNPRLATPNEARSPGPVLAQIKILPAALSTALGEAD